MKKILKGVLRILIVFVFLFLMFLGGMFAYDYFSTKLLPEEVKEEYVHVPLIELPEPVPTYANVLGVGDNLIHRYIYIQAQNRATNGDKYDFSFSYENIQDYISKADIASLNQETVMASSYEPASYPMFNSPQELGDLMVDIGFDVINLGNNHVLDKYEKGLVETLDFLHTKEDLVVVGAYHNEEAYLNIPIITENDIDFAFIGATQTTNGMVLPSGSDVVVPMVQSDSHVAELVEQVKRATAVSDVVVVNVHWGTEYTHTPTDFQVDVAHQLVMAGADVILGHHPHVIQPVEYIEKPNGTKAVVCYSLGNFISLQDKGPRMIGGMLDINFEKLSGKTTIENVTFLPVITHYDSGLKNISIYPYDNYTPEQAQKHGVRSYTSGFSHEYIYNIIVDVIDEEFLPKDFYEFFPYNY